MQERVLHQFPISHYCEKVRWVLDYKGLGYRVYNQVPGWHMRENRRLTGRTSVPLLRDGATVVSGSSRIALYLEQAQPGPSLLPRTAAGRALHDQLVQHFDDVVGVAVRRYIYRFLLPRTALFRQLFFREYRGLPKLVGELASYPLTLLIGRAYRVHASDAAHLPDELRRAADGIEERLRGGSPYLVDDAFSLADISVASLLGPLVGPAGSPWSEDLALPELQALRAEMRARSIGRWLSDRYLERSKSAAFS